MGKQIGRISGSLSATVALAVGILGLVPIWPAWVWIGLGVTGLVLIIGEFAWERQHDGGSRTPQPSVNQRQRGGGSKSTNNQAGRDININQPPGEPKT